MDIVEAAPQQAVRRREAVICAVGYVLAFALALALGNRMRIPYWYSQLLDPIHLRENYWESILHLHAQPPLFNAVLGAGLKMANDIVQLQPNIFGVGLNLNALVKTLMGEKRKKRKD